MRTFSFEPGDGSIELTVDHPLDVKPDDWRNPAVLILLRRPDAPEGAQRFRVLKQVGEVYDEEPNAS